jgi:hypothetical protein
VPHKLGRTQVLLYLLLRHRAAEIELHVEREAERVPRGVAGLDAPKRVDLVMNSRLP